MTLLEFLEDYLDEDPTRIVRGSELKRLRGRLLKLDEFKGIKHLLCVDESDDSESVGNFLTTKLRAGIPFKGVVVINYLNLTPLSYPRNIGTSFNTNEFGDSLNGYISPTMYDPTNFCPFKILKLKIDPSNSGNNNEILHKLLDDIMENTKKYSPKGDRGVLLKGLITYDE